MPNYSPADLARARAILTPARWEQIAAQAFKLIHAMNLETSYQDSGVIDMRPYLEAVLTNAIATALQAQRESAYPLASKNDKKNGWTLDFRFLSKVAEQVQTEDEQPSLEAVEAILLKAATIRAADTGQGEGT